MDRMGRARRYADGGFVAAQPPPWATISSSLAMRWESLRLRSIKLRKRGGKLSMTSISLSRQTSRPPNRRASWRASWDGDLAGMDGVLNHQPGHHLAEPGGQAQRFAIESSVRRTPRCRGRRRERRPHSRAPRRSSRAPRHRFDCKMPFRPVRHSSQIVHLKLVGISEKN